ncbi:MAG: hypothetical protein AB2L24_15995 [Mangrovibacterium sp.]
METTEKIAFREETKSRLKTFVLDLFDLSKEIPNTIESRNTERTIFTIGKFNLCKLQGCLQSKIKG